MNFMGLMNFYSQFKKNPMAILQNRFNIPSEMNNPEQIINHLVQTGQVSQEQINKVTQMRDMMK